MKTNTLTSERLQKMDAYWRAANDLSVGQICRFDNPLLKQPLKLAHIKPRLLGHWGKTPGLNCIHAHLKRVMKEHDLDGSCSTGPGYGGPSLVANAWRRFWAAGLLSSGTSFRPTHRCPRWNRRARR